MCVHSHPGIRDALKQHLAARMLLSGTLSPSYPLEAAFYFILLDVDTSYAPKGYHYKHRHLECGEARGWDGWDRRCEHAGLPPQ